MSLLLLAVLALLPFFVGVFALVLLTFRDDGSLLEEGYGRPDTFVEVFLIDFDPMGVPRLFTDLDAFLNLLFVGFQCGKILWGEYVGRAMKTRQFHKLTNDFRGFQTRTQCHLHILPVLTDPLWIKRIRACHWQQLPSGYICWFPSLNWTRPCCTVFSHCVRIVSSKIFA